MATPRLVVELDYEQIKKAGTDIKKTFADLGVSAETYEKKLRNTEKGLQRQERQFNSLKRSLDPVYAAQVKYQRSVELLDSALKRGLTTQAEHNRLVAASRAQYQQAVSGGNKLTESLKSMAARYLSIVAAVALVRKAYMSMIDVLRYSIQQAANEQQQLLLIDAHIRSTGKAAGWTTPQLKALADQLQDTTGISNDTIASVEGLVLTFTNVRGTNVKATTEAILNLNRALGGTQGLNETAIQVGKALNDPVLGMTSLRRVGISLNPIMVEQAKNLLATGKTAEAQAIILKELNKETEASAAAYRNSFNGALDAAKNAVSDLSKNIGSELLPQLTYLLNAFVEWTKKRDVVIFFKAIGILLHTLIQQISQFLDLYQRVFNIHFGPKMKAEDVALPTGNYAPADLSAFNAKNKGLVDDFKKSLDHLVSSYAELDKEQETFNNRVEDLRKQYDPVGAQIEETKKKLDDLNKITKNGTTRMDEYGNALSRVQDEYDRITAKAPDRSVFAPLEITPRTLQDVKELKADGADAAVTWGKVSNSFDDINRGFGESVGKGLHDAAVGFFAEMDSGLTDGLHGPLKSFADALINAANEWLAQMLLNIAKAKAAGQGIGSAGGGGGGGLGGLGSLAKIFGGGGGAGGGMGAAGAALIGVAVIAGIAAYDKHRHDQAFAQQYGTFAQVGGFVGMQGISGGYLSETQKDALNGLRDVFSALRETLRAGSDSMKSAEIRIRNDKKDFEVFVSGVLVGHFKTLAQAITAAAAKAFTDAAKDPALQQVLANAAQKFADPSALADAVAKVKGLVDMANGLDELGVTISNIVPGIQKLEEELRSYGLTVDQVARLSGASALQQFRAAWQSLSGEQQSPAEKRKMAEANRQLLLGQMKLERAKLQADLARLKISLAISKGEIQLDEHVLDARHRFVEAEGNLYGGELHMMKTYVDTRAQLVNATSDVLQAEIDAIQQQLAALDQLIGHVSIGRINIGRIGGGGRGGGGSYQDRLTTALERLINAIDKLREFQKGLAQSELSPYTTQARFQLAQNTFNTLSQRALAGDVSAIEQLPGASQQYLELAQQMFGTAGHGYGRIFDSVNALLQQISAQYPQGNDPQAWLRSGMDSVNHYLENLGFDSRIRRRQHDETNQRLHQVERNTQGLREDMHAYTQELNRNLATRPANNPRNGGHQAA